jgi:hypothetical protein
VADLISRSIPDPPARRRVVAAVHRQRPRLSGAGPLNITPELIDGTP